jgi:hypothetical protein
MVNAGEDIRRSIIIQQQKAGADFAILAIRTLNLASGGALLAILTFLGNLWGKGSDVATPVANGLSLAIWGFAIALVLSLVTAMGGYASALAQMYRLTKPNSSLGRFAFEIRWIAIAVGVLAVIAFAISCGVAAWSLQGVNHKVLIEIRMPLHTLNAIGLLLGMIGIVIIFVWGPPQPDFQDYIGLSVGGPDEEKLKAEVRQKKKRHWMMSSIGLTFIFVGFFFQFLDAWY